MITFRIYHNGTYGFIIKTGIVKNNVEIAHHSYGYQDEETTRKAADEILKVYKKHGHEIKEIKP